MTWAKWERLMKLADIYEPGALKWRLVARRFQQRVSKRYLLIVVKKVKA